MWTAKPFDRNKGGSQPLMCLKNTRLGYGIPSFYLSAWDAWLHTEQHKEPIPVGIDVPVFFWFKNEANGHIGVRLADGRFWSDGAVYLSITAYESRHAPRYVGWGESINNVKVLTKQEESVMINRDMLAQLWSGFLDRYPTDSEFKNFVGKPVEAVIATVHNSKEFKDRMDSLRNTYNELQKYKQGDQYIKVSEFYIKKG